MNFFENISKLFSRCPRASGVFVSGSLPSNRMLSKKFGWGEFAGHFANLSKLIQSKNN